MPICWTVHPELQRTVVTFADPYTFQQWDAAFAEMIAARACEPWRTFLIDRRHSAPPTSQFVRMMSNTLSGHAARVGPARVAVVVGDDVGFGMGRMVQMNTEAINPAISMRIFRSYDEAERWLVVSDRPAN